MQPAAVGLDRASFRFTLLIHRNRVCQILLSGRSCHRIFILSNPLRLHDKVVLLLVRCCFCGSKLLILQWVFWGACHCFPFSFLRCVGLCCMSFCCRVSCYILILKFSLRIGVQANGDSNIVHLRSRSLFLFSILSISNHNFV